MKVTKIHTIYRFKQSEIQSEIQSKTLMYEFSSNRLELYWHDRVHLPYMDTDSSTFSFDANNQELTNFFTTKQK